MKTTISRWVLIPVVTSCVALCGIVMTSSITPFGSQAIGSPKPLIVTQIPSGQLGKPLQVELGNKAVVLPEQLEIRVLSIQDSRCPKNVDCYWGGEAHVQINLSRAEKNLGDLTLTLGVGNPDYFYPNNIKRVGKYYVRVLKVEPYPEGHSQKGIQTVTLQVQKTSFKLQGTPPASRL
jgi:hypothetical protein